MKLLIVEDEIMLLNLIVKGLKKSGYAVDQAEDGEKALEQYETNEYDLIVLDLNLPKIDGIDVLTTIRSTDPNVKILILSARSEIEDRITGLDLGANDYLVKPFDFRELEARIRSLLLRNFTQEDNVLSYKNIVLDMKRKSVTYEHNLIDLTKKEYGILEYLMLHKDEVISTEQLIEHVWESNADLFSNSFKFHMSSLKKKLASVTGDSSIISNLRGQGYIINSKSE